MTKATEVRQAVQAKLEEFGTVKVLLAPTDYNQSFGPPEELRLAAIIKVGPEGPESDVRVDELFEKVPEALHEDRTLDGNVQDINVMRCSGHRLYAIGPDATPELGAEWSIKVVV